MTTRVMTSEEIIQNDDVRITVVTAGTCNYFDENGNSMRNPHRDELHALLNEMGIRPFEVQIHEDTHGRGYDWETDGSIEKLARDVAEIRIYQILPVAALSAITSQEVLVDVAHGRKAIVWLPDLGNGHEFYIPGLGTRNDIKNMKEELVAAHGELIYEIIYSYVNTGRQIRNELLAFLNNLSEEQKALITIVKEGVEEVIDAVKQNLTLA